MAEKGVHITQNIQIKPSIFEVVAAESLNSTFYPAIKRVANVNKRSSIYFLIYFIVLSIEIFCSF